MEEFTNRELKILFNGVSDKMDTQNKTVMDKMDAQHKDVSERIDGLSVHVKKTNGRVKKLEIWKAGIVSAITVIVFGGGAFLIMARENLENDISKMVIAELEQRYEIETQD
jgi:hypothetical protein